MASPRFFEETPPKRPLFKSVREAARKAAKSIKNFWNNNSGKIVGFGIALAVAAVVAGTAVALWPIYGTLLLGTGAVVGLASAVSAVAGFFGLSVAATTAATIAGSIMVAGAGLVASLTFGVIGGFAAKSKGKEEVYAPLSDEATPVLTGTQANVGRATGATQTNVDPNAHAAPKAAVTADPKAAVTAAPNAAPNVDKKADKEESTGFTLSSSSLY